MTTLDNIVSYALDRDNVIGARTFEYNGECVLALISTPFYLKSERDEFLRTLSMELSSRLNCPVYVTFDMDIFRAIDNDLSDEQRQELLDKVKTRIGR